MVVMEENDVEDFLSDDDDADNAQYAKLQESVAQLDSSQRIRSAKRNELGSLISEYHVKEKDKRGTVHTKELANVLGAKKNKINKKVTKVTTSAKKLPKPLEKPIAEQIKRKIGFELVKEQLGSWEAVVESNRVADHLVFPYNEPKLTVNDNSDYFSKKSELERDLHEVLHGKQEPIVKEDTDEFPLTLEEIIERRKELAGIRARQSYKEAKAFRQSKIKSKKYHRLQKREKIKQQIKEFETLQKTDPEAALQKLMELEKSRAEERATLRHRNTGKWAQNLAVRAKYDKDSRKVLAEQLTLSRDIAMKPKPVDSSDEDETEPDPTVLKEALEIAESNPWSLEVSSEVNSFISGFRKYWNEKNGNPAVEEEKPQEIKIDQEETVPVETIKCGSTAKWTVTQTSTVEAKEPKRKLEGQDLDESFYLADQKLAEKISKKFKSLQGKIKPATEVFTKKSKKSEPNLKMTKSRWHVERAVVDEELGDTTLELDGPVPTKSAETRSESRPSDVNIDPEKFLKVTPKVVKTPLPDDAAAGDEEGLEDDDDQQKVIMEAFADDNVTDFRKAKEEAEKETQPEVVAELPGWGSWGGAGIVATKRKRRRFLKIPELPARKDKGLADVIINEDANKTIKNHMVKEVPFPFKSVEAFEANIRAPVTREFIPELTHRALIRPEIITRQGAIIEPMSDDVLIRNRPKMKSVFQAKTKSAV